MANHKSALKRIRQNETRRVANKYYHKSTRNAIRNLKNEENKEAAQSSLSKVISMIDKLSKKNIIHKNKAANLKSQLQSRVASL